ncbi:hypothetical protein FOA52_015555 [Chlamydomonas sp. UWO 241]|nr:hypothetical protein FOA52_015555 [Chlamydomonas sp. UWO 241]
MRARAPVRLLLVAAALACLGLASCDPGLLRSIAKDPEGAAFLLALDGASKDSLFVEASDCGVLVVNFSTSIPNDVYPHSPPRLAVSLTLLLRYTYYDGTVSLKGVLSAETRDVHKLPGDVIIRPTFTLSSPGRGAGGEGGTHGAHGDTHGSTLLSAAGGEAGTQASMQGGARGDTHGSTLLGGAATRGEGDTHGDPRASSSTAAAAAGMEAGTRHAWRVPGGVHSYWDAPAQAAMVHGFEASFALGDPEHHSWTLTCDMDPETAYVYNPSKQLNAVDGRGIEQPPYAEPRDTQDKDTYVVMKLTLGLPVALMGTLIVRHVEYYQSLGVSKHIIYVRKRDIPPLLLSSRKLANLCERGMVMLVLWDSVPAHELWTLRYDHRIAFSHAMLATTGLPATLLFVDLDEYLVTPVPGLQGAPIGELLQTCAGARFAEARLPRYHALCGECSLARPEAFLWGLSAQEQFPRKHPLAWYTLTNFVKKPTTRSAVDPNAARAVYVSMAKPRPGLNATAVSGDCMFLLHIVHMVQVQFSQRKVEARFTPDARTLL